MSIVECKIKQPGFNKFLYRFIGEPWLWIDKLSWSDKQWEGTERVWVHTCTLDHPGALQNYQCRGMQIYKMETEEQEI